jgi:hypothetical protein
MPSEDMEFQEGWPKRLVCPIHLLPGLGSSVLWESSDTAPEENRIFQERKLVPLAFFFLCSFFFFLFLPAPFLLPLVWRRKSERRERNHIDTKPTGWGHGSRG